jgi:hypothetical protein
LAEAARSGVHRPSGRKNVVASVVMLAGVVIGITQWMAWFR